MARPRSEVAHKKVLRAAVNLMASRGLDATSMDAIAERAGVSKATIYNHWPDKEALFLEVMASLHGLRDRPAFDSGDTRADLIAVLAYRSPRQRRSIQKRILPEFVAYAARNPKFGDAWRNMAIEPPMRELARLLKQAVARGELLDLPASEVALSLLLGPMLYHHIFLGHQSLAPEELARTVVSAFWRAFDRKPSPASERRPRLRAVSV